MGELCFSCSIRYIESSFILGCSGLAGLYRELEEETSVSIVVEAVSLGIRLFDTAPHYGLGLSEERLAIAFQSVDRLLLDQIKLWTKVGRIVKEVKDEKDFAELAKCRVDSENIPNSDGCVFPGTPANRIAVFDYSESGAIKSFEDSTLRLRNIVKIFGLRIHDCDNEWKLASTMDDEIGGLIGLARLRNQGLVRDIGIGLNDANYGIAIVNGFHAESLDTVMIAGCWNLVHQEESCLQLMQLCSSRGIRIHLAGVFASGLLVGGSNCRYVPATESDREKKRRWEELCAEYALPLPAVALSFCLLPSCVEAVAIGVMSVAELRQVVEWFHTRIPVDIFHEAKKLGLLEPFVPLPAIGI